MWFVKYILYYELVVLDDGFPQLVTRCVFRYHVSKSSLLQ